MDRMIDETRLMRAIDRTEILDVISRSIIARDSGRWDDLAACYHSRADFNSSWWNGKPADFIPAARRKLDKAREAGGEQKHMTSNHWIEIKGERATAECDLILHMRSRVAGIDLDFATFSRRLHLLEREEGDWKIMHRFAIYEKDQVAATSPEIDLAPVFAEAGIDRYPRQLRYHLWRNDALGSPPSKSLCIRGSEEEADVRNQARAWLV